MNPKAHKCLPGTSPYMYHKVNTMVNGPYICPKVNTVHKTKIVKKANSSTKPTESTPTTKAEPTHTHRPPPPRGERTAEKTPSYLRSGLKVAHLNVCASRTLLNKAQSIILNFAKRKTDLICLTKIKISKTNKNFYHHKHYNTYLNLPPDPLNNAPR